MSSPSPFADGGKFFEFADAEGSAFWDSPLCGSLGSDRVLYKGPQPGLPSPSPPTASPQVADASVSAATSGFGNVFLWGASYFPLWRCVVKNFVIVQNL